MRSRTLCFVAFVAGLAAQATADIVVDGRLDPAEGYMHSWQFDMNVENYGLVTSGAELWLHRDMPTGDVYMLFAISPAYVDNTYGANSIGWGQQAPSGKHHNFADLIESDRADIRVWDGLGNVVFDFGLDFLSDLGDGTYACQGVTGEDGVVFVGSPSDLLEFGSSLDYNFNSLGYVLTQDSPATDANYTENPTYPGWEFKVVYEARISGSVFINGFGGVTVPIVHASPNKLGRKAYPLMSDPVAPPAIPEPTTALLFGPMAVTLIAIRRRRSRTSAS